jgi:hypothetical protein
MKKYLFLTILLLFLPYQLFSQEILKCPNVSIKAPVEMIHAGESMNFAVSFSGETDTKNLEFLWLVSGGTISVGQGTMSISLLTNNEMHGMTVTATVEIKGLPEGCVSVYSASGDLFPAPLPPVCRCTLDEYGRIPWTVEMQRLDSIRVELVNDPKAKAFIIFSAVGNSDLKLVNNRQKKIIRFFQKYAGVPPSRLIMQVENRGDYNSKLYVVPEGAEMPF